MRFLTGRSDAFLTPKGTRKRSLAPRLFEGRRALCAIKEALLYVLLLGLIDDVAGICLLFGDLDVAAGAGETVLEPVDDGD